MTTDNNANFSTQQNRDAVISYLLLRQLIGILGLLLPFILTAGAYFFGHCNQLQPSISHYYYSIMHIVFIGTLCVLGGFLITYRGKSKLENRVSNYAGAFAFCVAIFPTGFDGFIGKGGNSCQFIQLTTAYPENKVPQYIGWLHFGFAALLFICFVIFCMQIFQLPDENKPIDYKKIRRNKVYKICGIIIIISILCIAAITLYNRITSLHIFPYYIYVFETTSLIPFGFSWLLKGSLNWRSSRYGLLSKSIQYFR